MTTKQAGLALGLSISRIQQACKDYGFLKEGRDYHITDSQLEVIRQAMGRRGRPPA